MNQKIVYIGNPADFVKAFELGDIADELLRAKEYFDYAGGVCLPKNIFDERSKLFPQAILTALKDLSNEKRGNAYLRSKKYYLNFIYEDNVEKIRERLLENLSEVIEHINILSELELPSELESKLMVTSILDLKKHYSMCVLNAFFTHMLKEHLDIQIYESAKESCIKDISNFYQFLFTGNLGEQGKPSEDILTTFKNALLVPSPTPPTIYAPLGESSATKMIIREMDHPMQIIFFAGSLLNQDMGGTIDFVVNPLSGALEIGYALKAIYTVLGVDKIDDVLLIKYSHYGEDNGIQSSLTPFVPPQLINEVNKIKNRRVLIIDDNTFSGETLYNLKEICSLYTPKVGIASIERRTDIKEPQKIGFEDLDIKPISKLRYIGRVVDFIRNNNLHGL